MLQGETLVDCDQQNWLRSVHLESRIAEVEPPLGSLALCDFLAPKLVPEAAAFRVRVLTMVGDREEYLRVLYLTVLVR